VALMDGEFLWTCVLHMTLASYLHAQPKADQQVKRMAKRYMKQVPNSNKLAKRTLRNVVKTNHPARLVQIAYDELIGEYNASISAD